MEGGDWRSQLHPDSRQRIVDKIMETLKRHLPFSGQEGLQELKKMAVRIEKEIYNEATSQSDYLRKLSLNILKESTPISIESFKSSAVSTSENLQDPDSSTRLGNANGGDWQDEIYQKIKSMNEMYFPELNEMYQRMAAKLQLHDALPQQANNEQLEKLRFFKVMLERLIMFLRTSKSEIQPAHKEKIAAVEKQIVIILSSNRHRKPISSLQQGQFAPPHMHAMQQSQQQQPQISQMHTNEGQMNSQMQPMNVPGSVSATQQNNLTNLLHNLEGLGLSSARR